MNDEEILFRKMDRIGELEDELSECRKKLAYEAKEKRRAIEHATVMSRKLAECRDMSCWLCVQRSGGLLMVTRDIGGQGLTFQEGATARVSCTRWGCRSHSAGASDKSDTRK